MTATMSIPPIMSARPKKTEKEFLDRCARVKPGIDLEKISLVANDRIKYLLSSKTAQRQQKWHEQELEIRWYAAMAEGRYDWTVYEDDIYLADLWASWIVYSRKYLLSMMKPAKLRYDEEEYVVVEESLLGRMENPQKIVDVGCGIAYTTAAFKQAYPSARVVGTNLGDTLQFKFCKLMSELYGFEVAAKPEDVPGHADVLFASEYFEHFDFDSYVFNGSRISGGSMARRFNSEMRSLGYRKIPTSVWNGRPTYWLKGR